MIVRNRFKVIVSWNWAPPYEDDPRGTEVIVECNWENTEASYSKRTYSLSPEEAESIVNMDALNQLERWRKPTEEKIGNSQDDVLSSTYVQGEFNNELL